MMNEMIEKITLNDQKKKQILENGQQIADKRKRTTKIRYHTIIVLLLVIGITELFISGNSNIINRYPIQVYAQEISGIDEVKLAENSVFTLEKVQTPMGMGYKLYTSINDGYYCETVSNTTNEGLEAVFSKENDLYWIPDYWNNKEVKIYDKNGIALNQQNIPSNPTTTVTYCVYNEKDLLQLQITIALQEIDGVGKGEILRIMSYPDLESK